MALEFIIIFNHLNFKSHGGVNITIIFISKYEETKCQ